ncbi:glycoside hydrolase family protein [Acidicapsa acidisoli]|uniref:glycoside hydrolase family protein n=1 Tax=Acidicapsa acidisoli TaxID=1615681 RepID=UPI0021E0DC80|nr:glycoside hydrolase family protein [Acidicapsa acidisoli]
MDLALTKQWITHWESTRLQSYDDATGTPLNPGDTPKGNPTIGVGFNLVAAGAQATIEALGLDFNAVLTGAVNITPDQVDQLLTITINSAIAGATKLVPIFDNLPDIPQMVLTDLVFNMGEPRFAQFVNTLKFINAQDWTNAANNLQQSLWFNQVGRRGRGDVAVLSGTSTPQQILAT